MATIPQVSSRLGWRARRRLEQIQIREAAAQLRETEAKSDAAVLDVQRRAGNRQRAEDDAHGAEDARRARDTELAQRAQRIGGVAGITAGFCLFVTAVGQVMFYTSLPWSGIYTVVAYVLFMGIECPAWYFAYNARDLADRGKDYGWSARRVWVFAVAAAAINSYHGAQFFGRWDMGLILGVPSLIGPYVWHKHVHRLEMLAVGRSREAVKAALRRRLRNPILSSRAATMWAQTGCRISREKAFLLVYFERHHRFPGELSEEAQAALRQRAEQRSGPVLDAADQHATDSGIPCLPGAADDALGDAAVGGVSATVNMELEAYLRRITSDADSSGGSALSGHAVNGHSPSSNGVSAPNGSAATVGAVLTSVSAEVPRRPQSPTQRPTRRNVGRGQRRRQQGIQRGDTRAAIEQYVRAAVDAGTALDDITGPMAAAAVGCKESTARNLLKDIKAAM